jgi:hypothetical protein
VSLGKGQYRYSEIAGAPNSPGVYSWYYRIELTDKDIAACIREVEQEASEDDREAIMRTFLQTHLFRFYKEEPYMVALSGPLKPTYEGHIDHRADISLSLVQRLSRAPANLYDLKKALMLTVPFFASPIYIGVATRLRERLMQHVRLIDSLQNLRASSASIKPVAISAFEDEYSDHKFAHEVSMIREFRPSGLIVHTLELPVSDSIRYDLENVLNRINYPLCGRN